MPLRIAMWSGPRNISTALMRAWENRPDTVVIDEPFYAHYLLATGLPHPGASEVIAQHELDPRRIIDTLLGPVPGGAPIFYQKHMAHHLLPGIDRAWLDHVTNCFLVRDPREMLASLAKAIPHPRLEDTGLPQQVEIFNHVRGRTAELPVVLDARDVLQNPERTLRMLCDRLGIDFSDRMLHWPAGPRDTDGIWAPHWYAAVWKSTGFEPYRPKQEPLPPYLHDLRDECVAFYEHLHAHRLH
jgi:hypothetical protein